MNSELLNSQQLKAEARRLGFAACGVARAAEVKPSAREEYARWVAGKHHAAMDYLERNTHLRFDPRQLVEGARSVVSVAMSYVPAHPLPADGYQIAAYALGKDYHDVMKQRLRALATAMGMEEEQIRPQSSTPQPLPCPPRKGRELPNMSANQRVNSRDSGPARLPQQPTIINPTSEETGHAAVSTADDSDGGAAPSPFVEGRGGAVEGWGGAVYRPFVDSGPVMERYWAVQAGIGWTGRNHLLIIPGAGSMFFLGEIITTAAFDHYDAPIASRCGTCHACLDACPSGALGDVFCAERCLSYQTIEQRGPLSPDAPAQMGTTIYGCDRCQQACPWNSKATPTPFADFAPSAELLAMTPEKWQHLTIDDYRRLFKGSAVKRAKYEGLMRNIAAVAAAHHPFPAED